MHRSARSTRSLGIGTVAMAAASAVIASGAPAAMAGEPKAAESVCEGQSFTQQFLTYGDNRFYTPMPGGEFNNEEEGWTLSGGASVIEAVRPDGSTGGVLSVPVGGKAVSPPMCVTLAYPTAKAWVSGTGSGKGIAVSVAYAGTLSAETPEEVGKVASKGTWRLGRFNVAPTLGGAEEAPREVRFIFEGRKGTNQLFGVYVDPRMTR